MTDNISVPAALLADVCRGQPFAFQPSCENGPPPAPERAAELLQRSGLTENRLARRFGVEHSRLADVSFRLWQSTFSEERDRRAGEDANQQKRGRVSRELRAELEKALADGNN